MIVEVVTILFNFHHWACVVGLVLVKEEGPK